MSCISRAIRARSAAAPSRPSWSRSNSSRAAFSCSEASSALRWRIETPSTPAAVASPVSPTQTFSGSDGDQRTAAMIAPSSTVPAARAPSIKLPSSATQYRAISTAASASCGAASSHCANATSAISAKAQKRAHATQQQRRAQGAAEDHGERVEAMLGRQAHDAQGRRGQADREIDRERVAGAQPAQPLQRAGSARSRQALARSHACVHIGGSPRSERGRGSRSPPSLCSYSNSASRSEPGV